MLDRSSRPVPGSSLTSASSRNGFRNSGNNASGKTLLANIANRCLPVFFLITLRKSICLFWTLSAPSFWLASSWRSLKFCDRSQRDCLRRVKTPFSAVWYLLLLALWSCTLSTFCVATLSLAGDTSWVRVWKARCEKTCLTRTSA